MKQYIMLFLLLLIGIPIIRILLIYKENLYASTAFPFYFKKIRTTSDAGLITTQQILESFCG